MVDYAYSSTESFHFEYNSNQGVMLWGWMAYDVLKNFVYIILNCIHSGQITSSQSLKSFILLFMQLS